MRNLSAILFDLDDTLYPERDYVQQPDPSHGTSLEKSESQIEGRDSLTEAVAPW